MLAPMQKAEAKPRTVTHENREESARLKAIWDAKDGRPSQLKFGEEFDIGNQAAVGFFLNGQSALSLKAAKGFAKGLGCLIGDFSPRLHNEIAELAKYSGIGWPLQRVERSRWDALTPEDRAYVEGVLDSAIRQCEMAGKPGDATHGVVRGDALQDVTLYGRSALSPAPPHRLTADEAYSVGAVEGNKSGSSHKARRMEGKADGGRPQSASGKGGKR